MKKLLLILLVLCMSSVSSAAYEQAANQYDDLVNALKTAANAEDLSGRSQYTLLFEYDLKTGFFGNGSAEVLNMGDLKLYNLSSPDDLDIAKKKISYRELNVHDELSIEFNVVEYQRRGVSRGAQTAMFTLLRDKRTGKVNLKLIGTVEERGTILYSELTKDKYTIAFIENRKYDSNRPMVLTIDLNNTLDMRAYQCTNATLKDCTYTASYLGGKFIQNGFRH